MKFITAQSQHTTGREESFVSDRTFMEKATNAYH